MYKLSLFICHKVYRLFGHITRIKINDLTETIHIYENKLKFQSYHYFKNDLPIYYNSEYLDGISFHKRYTHMITFTICSDTTVNILSENVDLFYMLDKEYTLYTINGFELINI